MNKESLPLWGRLFCVVVDSKTESGAKNIQYQIINVAAAYQSK